MISVEEAHAIVSTNTRDFGEENIALENCHGRVLAEDIIADRDFPPYDRVAMDGIAISYNAFSKGKRTFQIEGLVAAGDPRTSVINKENCFEIMTGAILPENLDTVVRYEDIEIRNGAALIRIKEVKKGQNIHRQGSDRRAGEIVLHKGQAVSPAEIGVLATVGKTRVLVKRLPAVIIVSTGNELVEISEIPKDHQIRKSNVERIRTSLLAYGLKPDTDHILDDIQGLRTRLEQHLDKYDVIILSGGVSKGKLDFVPRVLEELGVTKLFHRVKQRPGKPFWFGKSKDQTTIFAMPGNPVSSFLCTHRYFLPWLRKSMGLKEIRGYAVLKEDISFDKDLTMFADVRLEFGQDGVIYATPVKGGGSGDLAKLADSDAFLELPANKDTFKKGEAFRFWTYRDH